MSGGKSGVEENVRWCDESGSGVLCGGEVEGSGSMLGDLINLFSCEVKLA